MLHCFIVSLFYCLMQLLPRPLWDAYEDASCRTSFPPSAKCQELTQQAEMLTSGEDAYALDFPVCNSSGNLARERAGRRKGGCG